MNTYQEREVRRREERDSLWSFIARERESVQIDDMLGEGQKSAKGVRRREKMKINPKPSTHLLSVR